MASLEQALREKGKDHKRLKDNFDTLKQANDVLKNEVGLMSVMWSQISVFGIVYIFFVHDM